MDTVFPSLTMAQNLLLSMRRACVFMLIGFAWLSPLALCEELGSDSSALAFERDIRPIFRTYCFDCHGASAEKKGKLDLRLARFVLHGGKSGAAVVARDPSKSLLLSRLRKGEMPPGDVRISGKDIETIERWIAGGAATARPEPESIGPGIGITLEERQFWSLRPISNPAIPALNDDRIRDPIDAFIRSAMPEGLSFSRDAESRTLLERLSFDLTGLPPPAEFASQYLDDPSDEAYATLVDELLESPHFGEQWARHWLDVAGYADSEGGANSDAIRPWSYKYRDWVIRALNRDLPLDQFLTEQLAGDELAGDKHGDWTPEQIELLTATGFLRMAVDGTDSRNDPATRNQVMSDTLQILGSSLLGLSVGCAQCHNHRYDPILHTDYYALRAIFEPALDCKKWQTPRQRRVSLLTRAERESGAQVEKDVQVVSAEKSKKQKIYLDEVLEKELLEYEEPLRGKLREAYRTPGNKRSAEQKKLLSKRPNLKIHPGVLYQYNQKAADDLKSYDKRIAEIRKKKPTEEFLRVLIEPPGHRPPTHRFHRGDYRQPQEIVAPGIPIVLSSDQSGAALDLATQADKSSGRRSAFARWLTGNTNPLTARVLSNRIWMHLFGLGLVSTPGDFGKLGSRPTHPRLLDHLAHDLRASGWSLKRQIRNIVLSTTYRQSSHRDTARNAIDRTNRYYWKQRVRRLEAEAIRDRVLAATGQLDLTLFGPGAPIVEDAGGQIMVDARSKRRSIYVQARRSKPVALLEAFDAPVMVTNCAKRSSSTVATQSLMLLNGPFILNQAAALADRCQREAGKRIDPSKTSGISIARSPSVWEYGYGDARDGVVTFSPLTHFTGTQYQGGPKLPDPKLSWVLLHSGGGHPGSNPGLAAIRRWRAPASGVLRLRGTLSHGSDQGDGVRGRVISSRLGVLGEWIVSKNSAKTSIDSLELRQGDTIDFITDCRGGQNSDSFSWTVELSLQSASSEGDGTAPARTWKSASGFAGPLSETKDDAPLVSQVATAFELAYGRPVTRDEVKLGAKFVEEQLLVMRETPRDLPDKRTASAQALTNLCHMLLISNEFLYVE